MERIIIRGPIRDLSGYARVARQIFFSLYNTKKYDVILSPLIWVNASPLFFSPEENRITEQAATREVSYKDATCIQVTLAKEFRPLAKYNIGVTTLETDIWLEEWVDKCNQMDEIWVLSTHNIRAATWSGVKVPVRIIPLGVDFNKFPAKGNFPYRFATNFNFLVSGQWHQGYDRKNIAKTVEIFLDVFKGNKDVGLVLKTFCMDNSIVDFYRTRNMLDRILLRREGDFPRVYLVHGVLRDSGMQKLFSHPQIKSLVSFSKGEGLWWDGLNAVAAAKPIVCTGWGGHTDYLDRLYSLFVDYQFYQTEANWKGVFSPEQRWAMIDEDDAKEKLLRCYENYENLENLAIQYRDKMVGKRNISVTSEEIVKLIETPKKGFDISTLPKASIAMILTQTMGDVITGTSIVKAILRSYPPCEITWFIDKRFTNILEGSPVLGERVIFVEVSPSKDVYEQTNTILKAVSGKFDRVLTLSPLFEPRWQELKRDFVAFRAWQSGVTLTPEDYFYYVTTLPEDKKKIDELNLPEKFVLIHTKGGWIQKDWPIGRWKKLVKRLERDGIPVCQVGGKEDARVCSRNFAGKLTFRETFEMTKRAKLFIGPVSGCAHYAKAARIPMVLIEGCSSGLIAGLTKYYEDKVSIVRTKVPCEMACEKNFCKWKLHEGKGCALDVSVDVVYKTVVGRWNDE